MWRWEMVGWFVGVYFLRKPENKKGNITFPETKIAPETLGLEDEFPFGARPIFRGENVGCMEVILYHLSEPISFM